MLNKYSFRFNDITIKESGMDLIDCAQDLVRCDLCEIPFPPLFCEMCHKNICKACVGDHLLDASKEHKVVPFDQRGLTTKCPKHNTKICELYCNRCGIPVCSHCISSKLHYSHDVVDIGKGLVAKKKSIKRDLQELENSIYPQYQEAASNIPVQKTDVRKHSQNLSKSISKQREDLRKEIDIIMNRMQADIDESDSKHLAVIDTQDDIINNTIIEIEQSIADMKTMLESDDFHFVSSYRSRNEEYKNMPAKPQVSLQSFLPQKIIREHIHQEFGSLSKLAITSDDPHKSSEAVSLLPVRPLIEKPRILAEIKTEYGKSNGLCSVSCLGDNEFWTCGQDKFMRLYNLQGNLIQCVQTKSGKRPREINVIQGVFVVYTDPYSSTSSIDILTNALIFTIIRQQGWVPLYLCSSSSGDLLVTMVSDDMKYTKVVRYFGSTEKQSIQFDEQGKPLFSSDPENVIKYLSENRNSDICVADCYARAVVVVSAAGKLRFRYTGHVSPTREPFFPVGITTDSQSKILVADNSHRIHILDQRGRFLRYLEHCNLNVPYGLCVDSTDNLFVAEYNTGKVKKIQYYK